MAKPTFIKNLEQGTDEWLSMRVDAVTGTRAAKILLGIEEAEEVMREMVREHFGLPPEIVVTAAMERGKVMEPVAVRDYKYFHGSEGEDIGIVISGYHDWLRYSPDHLIFGNPERTYYSGVLEVKCPFSGVPYPEDKPQYINQTRMGIHVCDVDWGDLWIWGEKQQEVQCFIRDNEWFEEALDTIEQFYYRYQQVISDEDEANKYTAPLIRTRADSKWERAAKQFLEAQAYAKTAEAKLEQARREVIAVADGSDCEGFGVRARTYLSKKDKPVWRITSYD